MTPLTPQFTLHGGGASLQGIRSENQDRCFFQRSEDGSRAIGAIADGIGGLADGAGAAGTATGAAAGLAEWLFGVEAPTAEEIADRIRATYAHANARIAEGTGSRGRSGTTLVLVAITDEHLLVANVGDSRAYLFAEGGVHRLTADHSVVEELVRDGALSPEQAERSPYRNLLTRSLGDPDTPEVDVVVADAELDHLRRGATLILTSDGAHGVEGIMGAGRLKSALEGGGTPSEVARQLGQAAIDSGSRDNATVVLIESRPAAE